MYAMPQDAGCMYTSFLGFRVYIFRDLSTLGSAYHTTCVLAGHGHGAIIRIFYLLVAQQPTFDAAWVNL